MINLLNKLFKKETIIATQDCKHQWELVAKTYAAPIQSTINVEDPRFLFGVTTYNWHCNLCGAGYRDEMLGTDENRWNDIVDKVEKFGMQYIKAGNKVFGVAEWFPEIEK
jgi:hypothetical protein